MRSIKPHTFVLGLDGGGSQTTALVADAAGRLLGRGTAGPANYRAVGLAAAVAAIAAATREALAAAGISGQSLAVACLGLAGAARPEDRQRLHAAVEPLVSARRLLLTTDADVALAAGSPTTTGVVVIAGTGSIAFGRDAAGRTARAGGWGYLLGDEGSGYWIGREALAAVGRAADGRGPATALTAAVTAAWHLPAPPDLLDAVYGTPALRPKIAALAPLVAAVAAQGDPTACAILDRAGDELALAAAAVLQQLNCAAPPTVVLAGGVLLGCAPVRERLRAALAQRHPSANTVELQVEPAVGAVRLALRLLEGQER
ncbi:MAG: BadF/BadG/BcrA/BcrD type ATPase [Chloroflexi bacterium]|nr:BadF/BadG/BcrA/BcrD type ATPase [Chloroflexota bacterium]